MKHRSSQQSDPEALAAHAAGVAVSDHVSQRSGSVIRKSSAMKHDKRLNLLDVSFLSISMQEALLLIRNVIKEGGKETVYFINADCLNISSSDDEYRDILNTRSIVLPDGAGISIACRLIGERLQANLNGTDLLPELWDAASTEDITFYLLGADPGVAERMQQNLTNTYPGLRIVGQQHGFFDHNKDTEAVIAQINQAKPHVLLVAFGAPRQEKWIHKHREKLDCNIAIGVGGLFDFYSGDKKRAPLWMRKFGIEWMYRLYLEPGRLWRRYIIGNPLFVMRILRWKNKRG